MTTKPQHVAAALLLPLTLLVCPPSQAATPLDAIVGFFTPSTTSSSTSTTPNARANANYLGASIGSATSDGFCNGLSDCSTSDNAWKAYAGVPIQNGLILDAGYVNFGETKGKTTSGQATQAKRKGYTAAGVLTMPVSDSLHVFGKGGVVWWDSDETVAGVSNSTDGRDTFYGVGADYKISDNLGVRAEWEKYSGVGSDQLPDNKINMLSVGVSMSSL